MIISPFLVLFTAAGYANDGYNSRCPSNNQYYNYWKICDEPKCRQKPSFCGQDGKCADPTKGATLTYTKNGTTKYLCYPKEKVCADVFALFDLWSRLLESETGTYNGVTLDDDLYFRKNCLNGGECKDIHYDYDYVYDVKPRSPLGEKIAEGVCECKNGFTGRKCEIPPPTTAKPTPKPTPPPITSDCKNTVKGLDYKGFISKTTSGLKCQRWDRQFPHIHGLLTASADENFCRNPDDHSEPWCYTTSLFKRWEACNIPLCQTVDDPEFVYAKAEIFPNPALQRELRKVQGIVHMRQRKSTQGSFRTTDFIISIDGLPANSYHGFHIHSFGTIGASCSNTGGHYNPFSTNHGSPSANERHVGDLGNVLSNDRGSVILSYSDTKAVLYSLSSVVGRSFVIHAGMDDLGVNDDRGSKTTGNAGARLACGPILWSDGEVWAGPQP